MKPGLLFDLDGTLLNTLEDLTDATNYALAQFGYPPRSMEEVRRAVGNGAKNQIRRCLPEGTDEAVVKQVLQVYKPYYAAHCRIKTRPYAGIPEALAALGQHYPMAIVSNKPDEAVKNLCADYFPGIYALGEQPLCPRKPAPDMVLRGMDAIGVASCIYIGDSEVDVCTADNAGVPCIGVLWGFRDRDTLEAAGARHLCESPDKLTEIIEDIIHGK